MLQRTEDEVGTQVKLFLDDANIQLKKIDGVGISSVVPNLTDVFSIMAKKYFGVEPLIISSSLDLGIKIAYDDPNSVGADRICDAVAGFSAFGGPLIIIDFGTATTYDVVSSNRGLSRRCYCSRELRHRRLISIGEPRSSRRWSCTFPKTIGKDTVSRMQAGILFGAVDAMEGMVGRIQAEIKKFEDGEKKAMVIATGGFSQLMASQSKTIIEWVPSLVLDGVIYEKTHHQLRKSYSETTSPFSLFFRPHPPSISRSTACAG